MNVKEIMTQSAVSCSPNTNVGAAVELMWVHYCGVLPVVGPNNKLEGVVTDRDICIAMGTRNRLPGDITVGEIATRNVFTCRADDDIHQALQTMADKQVRRLPVVDDEGTPQGILSMDDVVAHTDLGRLPGRSEPLLQGADPKSKEVVQAAIPISSNEGHGGLTGSQTT